MASMLDAQRTGSGGLAKLGEGVRANSDSKTQAGLSRGPNQSKKLINAAWTDTFPAQGATLDLDFANDRGFVRGIGQGRSMDAVTFTRASLGRYVDANGLLAEAANNEPRFDWASTAVVAQRNLLEYTEQFDNAYWAKVVSAVSANTVATTDPLGGNTADLCYPSTSGFNRAIQRGTTVASLNIKTISVYAKAGGINWFSIRDNTAAWAWFDLANGVLGNVTSGYTALITSVGNGWYRCEATITSGVVTFPTFMFSDANISNSVTASGTNGIYFWGAQGETGDTATDYQPIAQPTTSTPLTANPTSNGLLIEEARTNRILWCRDATQADWVKTNITPAKDQTGIDGVANAASSLTATANDGTCIQTITLASGSRTNSVYLTRLIGTGNVQVSLDGSTWSTVDLSDTEWRRIVLSGTVTNPTVGIKLAVSGDAVAMDYGQVEDGAFATTPILTTAATATRAIDSCSGNNLQGWMNDGVGSIAVDCSTYVVPDTGTTLGTVFYFQNGANNWTYIRRSDASTFYNRVTLEIRTTVAGVINQNFALVVGDGLFGGQRSVFACNFFISDLAISNNFFSAIESSRPISYAISHNGTFTIGSNAAGGEHINGAIKRITYWPNKIRIDGLTEIFK